MTGRGVLTVLALILATFSMKCLALSSAENGLAFAAAGGDINALTFDQIAFMFPLHDAIACAQKSFSFI